MKRALSLLVLLLPLLLIMGCGSSDTESKPSDIQTAEQVSVTGMESTGATTKATSMTDVATLLSGISTSDTAVADLSAAFSSASTAKGLSPVTKAILSRALPGSKAFSSSFQSQIEAISSAVEDFPTSKSLNVSLSASGEALGSYFTLASLTGNLTATATTTDGLAIAFDADDNPTNLKAVTGSGQLSVSVNSHDLPSASCIKGIKLRSNTGGTATATANADATDGSATFDYAESFSAGISVVNASGLGGKIVFSVEAKGSGSVTSVVTAESSPDAFLSSLAITVAVYDDNNVQQFKGTYDSIADFETAIGITKS